MPLVRDTCKEYNDPSISNIFTDKSGVERYATWDYRSYSLAIASVKQQIKGFILSEVKKSGIIGARVSFYSMDFTALFGLNCVVIISNSLGGIKANAMLNKITLHVTATTERSSVLWKVSAKTDRTFTTELARQFADSLSKFINE
jgi:hypothetical protein